MAQPLPVQRPLQIGAREVLANIFRLHLKLPFLKTLFPDKASSCSVAAPENADVGNANQNPRLPEPPLEIHTVRLRVIFVTATKGTVNDAARVRVMPVKGERCRSRATEGNVCFSSMFAKQMLVKYDLIFLATPEL